jgi:HlyD family secretion protein
MIKNGAAVLAALALAGCGGADPTRGRYQGMVELEQIDLAFETGGRVTVRGVEPGRAVRAGDVIARQDDVLDREQRAIRARELDVARADLALLEAGSRPEEIRAAQAQLGAARASERALTKEQARQTRLVERGVAPAAVIDDVDAQVARARGERESLEARVRLLSRGARGEELVRARARVALAEEALALEDRRLEKRVLTAPIDSVVLDVYPQAGEVVAAGAPIASLVDRRRPYADVFVRRDRAGDRDPGPGPALRRPGRGGRRRPRGRQGRDLRRARPQRRGQVAPPSACCAGSSTRPAATAAWWATTSAPSPRRSRTASGT